MFDNLSLKLEKAFQTLKGQGKITEINVATTAKEIRKALIDADVNYKVAKEVTDDIKEKAMGQNVLTAISPGQLLVKITSDELTLRADTSGDRATVFVDSVGVTATFEAMSGFTTTGPRCFRTSRPRRPPSCSGGA